MPPRIALLQAVPDKLPGLPQFVETPLQKRRDDARALEKSRDCGTK
jgi:hypothetical protein